MIRVFDTVQGQIIIITRNQLHEHRRLVILLYTTNFGSLWDVFSLKFWCPN